MIRVDDKGAAAMLDVNFHIEVGTAHVTATGPQNVRFSFTTRLQPQVVSDLLTQWHDKTPLSCQIWNRQVRALYTDIQIEAQDGTGLYTVKVSGTGFFMQEDEENDPC